MYKAVHKLMILHAVNFVSACTLPGCVSQTWWAPYMHRPSNILSISSLPCRPALSAIALVQQKQTALSDEDVQPIRKGGKMLP